MSDGLGNLLGGKSEGGDVTILQKGLRINKDVATGLQRIVTKKKSITPDEVRLAIKEYVEKYDK